MHCSAECHHAISDETSVHLWENKYHVTMGQSSYLFCRLVFWKDVYEKSFFFYKIGWNYFNEKYKSSAIINHLCGIVSIHRIPWFIISDGGPLHCINCTA